MAVWCGAADRRLSICCNRTSEPVPPSSSDPRFSALPPTTIHLVVHPRIHPDTSLHDELLIRLLVHYAATGQFILITHAICRTTGPDGQAFCLTTLVVDRTESMVTFHGHLIDGTGRKLDQGGHRLNLRKAQKDPPPLA